MSKNLDDLEVKLKDYFGFTSFRDGQKEIIEYLIKGENILSVMPTGFGKSLCYQLSALMLEGKTVIVSPLIALMNDQVSALKSSLGRGFSAAANRALWMRPFISEAALRVKVMHKISSGFST